MLFLFKLLGGSFSFKSLLKWGKWALIGIAIVVIGNVTYKAYDALSKRQAKKEAQAVTIATQAKDLERTSSANNQLTTDVGKLTDASKITINTSTAIVEKKADIVTKTDNIIKKKDERIKKIDNVIGKLSPTENNNDWKEREAAGATADAMWESFCLGQTHDGCKAIGTT